MGNPDHGKLGHKVYLEEAESKRKAGSYKPQSIGDQSRMDFVDLQNVKQVSCGFRHTACITEDGSVYTWGEGRNGQLGHSNTNDLIEPTKLDLSVKVVKVECGANFTMILDDTGKLYAFGDNRYGQLGITGLDNILLEHPAGIQLFLKKVVDFSCGEEHAAYVNNKGEVFTWGYGRDG